MTEVGVVGTWLMGHVLAPGFASGDDQVRLTDSSQEHSH
jgi:3-hydroxyacyl-CoA dehydrogenase